MNAKKLTDNQLKRLRQLNPKCRVTLECDQRANFPTKQCLTCPWYDYDVDWAAYEKATTHTHQSRGEKQ